MSDCIISTPTDGKPDRRYHNLERLEEDLGVEPGLHYGCARNLIPRCINVDFCEIVENISDHQPWHTISRFIGGKKLFLRYDDETMQLEHSFSQPVFFMRHKAPDFIPLPDASMNWVYSEHFIEHVDQNDAIGWLKEIHRIMKKGAILRLSTPDLGKFVHGYQENPPEIFENFRKGLAELGYHNAPRRRAWMINQIFFGYGHRWIYDANEIVYIATQAGFHAANCQLAAYRSGNSELLCSFDAPERQYESLYIEIQKS